MIINEDFFDEIDNETINSVEQNDLVEDKRETLSPDNYTHLFVIGMASTKVTDYSPRQLENLIDRITYILDVCNFITSHSVVKIVTRDERNLTHLVELTDETYYHMSFNVTFAVNCEIKRFRPFIAFVAQLLSILEKTDDKDKVYTIEIIKRSGSEYYWNVDSKHHKSFACTSTLLKNLLINKNKSGIEQMLLNRFLSIAFLFNKSGKVYKDICSIFGINDNPLISKQIFVDVNSGWADCPTSKQNGLTGIKFLTNKIKKKPVAGYLQELHKNSSYESIWKHVASKIRLYSIPTIMECLSSYEFLRDDAANYAINENVCPDDIYIRQFDNNRRLMVVMHLTTYYNKDWDLVVDVWCDVNTFCYESDKPKWVEIFKTIGEDVTDKDVDDLWNKLKKPEW